MPSWHYILLYRHSHHQDNVTAPHGRPKLRSRLHFCHAQEGRPRSPQGYVVALDKKNHVPLLCVQWKTRGDGQRNCPKHVEFYSKNKFEKLVHLVGFIIRIHFLIPCLLFRVKHFNVYPSTGFFPQSVTLENHISLESSGRILSRSATLKKYIIISAVINP